MENPTEITAKYVEFMYLDDISEFTTYKKFEKDEKKKYKKKLNNNRRKRK